MDTPPAPLTPLGARTPLAHPALYSVIAALSLVIIAGAAWVFWPRLEAVPDASDILPTPASSANWKLFESKLLPLSFRYPPGLSAGESEYLTAQGIPHTGSQVHFGEANGGFAPFDVITKDFSVVDSTPHDIVDGPLDSTTSFTVTVFDPQYQNITEVEPGMFRVDGYGNIECSPFISSLLIVNPPVTLGLEYAQFYLGSVPDFEESDMRSDDQCSPTDAAIRAKLTALKADANIAERLTVARAIARSLAALPATGGIRYRNDVYGLSVKLPENWRGFTVTQNQEVADPLDTQSEPISRTYTELHVVHPLSATSNPRQDIPILIFTLEQWEHVGQQGPNEWSVSAAPIPPSEMARNSRYVFALPARYNYAFLEGWEEVDELISAGAVTAFTPCTRRPACLDATPRCLLPEPAEGWCD